MGFCSVTHPIFTSCFILRFPRVVYGRGWRYKPLQVCYDMIKPQLASKRCFFSACRSIGTCHAKRTRHSIRRANAVHQSKHFNKNDLPSSRFYCIDMSPRPLLQTSTRKGANKPEKTIRLVENPEVASPRLGIKLKVITPVRVSYFSQSAVALKWRDLVTRRKTSCLAWHRDFPGTFGSCQKHTTSIGSQGLRSGTSAFGKAWKVFD